KGVENPLTTPPYNIEKADWEQFSQELLKLDQSDQYRSKLSEAPNIPIQEISGKDLDIEALSL
ncbi:hypothetical protein, partial [Staphylococcus sp. GDY8P64P]|uniref:hypothetical protein n=1 Tax=Staphylococcus sp. GDY8P64P TaxID=2804423 RepID=UPI00194EC52C